MVLKPLDNEDIEASETDEWGFFSPFYQGVCFLLSKISADLSRLISVDTFRF